MDSREKAILETLLYADLFDYPLTKDEIFKFVISKQKISKVTIEKILKRNNFPVRQAGQYYYLNGRNKLVKMREKRAVISERKLQRAQKFIKVISLIPTVKLIGISGTLAMNNCEKDDDIDLFVITEKKLVWLTRLIIVLILVVLGVYRNRKSRNNSDKICLNMILDEANMGFAKTAKDLYTAHEIAQLLPVFNKVNTYEKFIKKNFWIKDFLPNFMPRESIYISKQTFLDKLIIQFFRCLELEKIVKFLQLSYMREHITNETVEDGFLKFHPFDYKTIILKKYQGKILKYNL